MHGSGSVARAVCLLRHVRWCLGRKSRWVEVTPGVGAKPPACLIGGGSRCHISMLQVSQ